MPEPHLRASDADRAAVAEVLGAHMSAGRLTVAEYDERLTRAYAARTYGQLGELTSDLPATAPSAAVRPAGPSGAHDPGRTPVQSGTHGTSSCSPWHGGGGLRAAWASWATTAAIVISIWLFTSVASTEWIYPWPIWVIGPWGAVLLFQSLPLGGTSGREHTGHPGTGPARPQSAGRGRRH
ncbi:DUF1707 SHOCT-like domain-containing protein [Modestobacter lapidis]|nr:DUF1707 domain-containing protein [Modestobacter lapidis]